MVDEKDRLGNKLHDVEAAREDVWAKKLDEELLSRLRQKKAAEIPCPRCQKTLVARAERGVGFMACPDAHGAWLDGDVLKEVLEARK